MRNFVSFGGATENQLLLSHNIHVCCQWEENRFSHFHFSCLFQEGRFRLNFFLSQGRKCILNTDMYFAVNKMHVFSCSLCFKLLDR